MLAPGGKLGLIWNTRDTSVSWLAALEQLISAYYSPDVPRQQTMEWQRVFTQATDLFGPLGHTALHSEHLLTPSEIAARVLSISAFNVLPSAEKETARQRVLALLLAASHGAKPDVVEAAGVAGAGTGVETGAGTGAESAGLMAMPHVTDIYWTTRL